MRNSLYGLFMFVMGGIFLFGVIGILKHVRPYSVTITNGTPAIPYSSTLQADSVRYFCDTHVRVYVGKDSLDVKAKYITYKKN